MASDEVADQLEPFTFLDKSSLEATLKGSICSKYLNVSPIMFSDDTGNICGRCNSDNLENMIRHKAFEELVTNLTFPCANKGNGCLKVLKFSEVQESCSFQPVNCPLFHYNLFFEEKCFWTGKSKMLCDHLRTHEDIFLDPLQFTIQNWKYPIYKIFFTIVALINFINHYNMASDGVADQLEPFTFLDKSSLEAALKCSICSKYLNVSPIMFSEDTGNICGRCNSDNLKNITRQKAFEELVKNLTFPCANKGNGCLKVLKFSEVQEHQESCSFQPVNCPLFHYEFRGFGKKCLWTGNSKMLGEHLRTHEDRFLDPPQFTIGNLAYQIDNIFFTIIDNQVITVAIKCIKRYTYACKVMVNGNDLESQCFRYSLKMTNEEENYSLTMKRNRLEPLSELMDYAPEKILLIKTSKICDILQNSTKIIVRFEIEKKANNEIIQIIGNQNSDILSGGAVAISDEQKIVPSDEEILAELECPICQDYMIPPIYLCETGHSVCRDCKTKLQMCPSCRSPYANGRNFTLEMLTQKVKYPCRNREIGCSFVTTSDKIKQHQVNCELWRNLTS